MRLPRILICAGASNSGKTMITCGILQVLINKGLKPCAFKCGPDYIDPMFHSKIIGTKSRNLDSFFSNDDVLRYILQENSRGCDIAVLEGVMGYYDGLGGIRPESSTYDIGKVTKTPAILVINSRGMSGSLAAFIKGFKEFKRDSNIKGVIFNRMSGSIFEMVREYIESECEIKVLGYVPDMKDCHLESRHLGLVTPDEILSLKSDVELFANRIQNTVDFDSLLELASEAEAINSEEPRGGYFDYRAERKICVALARDEAFNFIYEDNIQLLKKMGAEITEFSPIHDKEIPKDADGIILYGGYPELYSSQLSDNISMRESIRNAINSGMPVMAECGGFMYLHEEMSDDKDRHYKQVGIINGNVFRTESLRRFGYVQLKGRGGFFNDFEEDVIIPAHEFHYYDSDLPGDDFIAQKPVGTRSWKCMHSTETMLAGYPHMYYYGNPAVPAQFLKKCCKYAERGENK